MRQEFSRNYYRIIEQF